MQGSTIKMITLENDVRFLYDCSQIVRDAFYNEHDTYGGDYRH